MVHPSNVDRDEVRMRSPKPRKLVECLLPFGTFLANVDVEVQIRNIKFWQ